MNKKTLKKTKEKLPVEPVIINTPGVYPVPIKEEKLPKKIKVLQCMANQDRSFSPGVPLEVGKDISEETAKSWLDCGIAEEDKSLEGPKETK